MEEIKRNLPLYNVLITVCTATPGCVSVFRVYYMQTNPRYTAKFLKYLAHKRHPSVHVLLRPTMYDRWPSPVSVPAL